MESPIPKRLKEARLLAKLSQKKLGIAAGVDEFSASARLNHYELGRHIPDYWTLKRIADVLSVPRSYFYAKEDELAEVIKLFFALSSDKRAKVLHFIKSITTKK